jgi:virulence-associated protein VagC
MAIRIVRVWDPNGHAVSHQKVRVRDLGEAIESGDVPGMPKAAEAQKVQCDFSQACTLPAKFRLKGTDKHYCKIHAKSFLQPLEQSVDTADRRPVKVPGRRVVSFGKYFGLVDEA